MGSTSSSSTMMFLHFVPFSDSIWFQEWVPASHGALVGACIGLFILGMLERLFSGMRGVLETYWRRKTDAILYRKYSSTVKLPSFSKSENEFSPLETLESNSTSDVSTIVVRRLLPPFILGHELSRAVLRTMQSGVGFAVMMAVMTFNASYIISIMLGIFTGEMLFGRFSSLLDHHA